MSVRFESANSEYATKTSFIANGDIILTAAGWFYLYALPATAAPVFTLYGSFAGFSLEANSAGKPQFHDYNSDSRTAGSTTLSTGTWYYIFVRKPQTGNGNALVYLDGSTSAEITTNCSMANASQTVQFAASEAGYGTDYWADCALVNWKFWTEDVAASEANTEKNSFTVSHTSGSLSAWHLDVYTDLTDSVSAKDLTATGTLSNGAANPFGGGGGGHLNRATPLDGMGGAGQQRFNPSLSYHRHPTISLEAYRREQARKHREFLEKVRRAA